METTGRRSLQSFEGQEFEGLEGGALAKARDRKVQGLSVETGSGEALFYSGYYRPYESERPDLHRNESLARSFQEHSDDGTSYKLLDDTDRGRYLRAMQEEVDRAEKRSNQPGFLEQQEANSSEEYLKQQGLPSTQRMQELWDEASAEFARGASGHVRTFVVGARDKDVFRREEQPSLMAQSELVRNDQVQTINDVPREELARIHLRDENRAFYHISRSEVERDRRETALGQHPSGVNPRIADRARWHQRTVAERGEVKNPRAFDLVPEKNVMGRRELAGVLKNLRGRAAEYDELRSQEKRVTSLEKEAEEAGRVAKEAKPSSVAALSASRRQERLQRRAQALRGRVNPQRLGAMADSLAHYENTLRRQHGAGALGHALRYEGPYRQGSPQQGSPQQGSPQQGSSRKDTRQQASGNPEPLSRSEAATIRSMRERSESRRERSHERPGRSLRTGPDATDERNHTSGRGSSGQRSSGRDGPSR